MPDPVIKRELSVHDTESRAFVDFLMDFLGKEEALERIKRVHRVIAMESGVYLSHWVIPNASFWLGLEACLTAIEHHGTLASRLTPEMYDPIEVAAKLRIFSKSMPQERLKEFRARILASDYLPPVFLEIDAAAHYWQLGYEIEWPPAPSGEGIRVPEFVASAAGTSIEVECKSQAPDSGRMVARPRFYRVADELNTLLASLGLAGKVLISVPVRLPASNEWKSELIEAVDRAAKAKSNMITLGDSTEIKLSLLPAANFVVPSTDLTREVAGLQVPHSHIAVAGLQYAGSIRSPLIVRVQSASPDQVLSSYLDDLRDANRQLSGDRAGVIMCFIPEIQSFHGLEAGSALHNMTAAFFTRHAKPFVCGVSYVSDSSLLREGLQITRSMPALAFRNHLYENKYGENLPLLSTG